MPEIEIDRLVIMLLVIDILLIFVPRIIFENYGE